MRTFRLIGLVLMAFVIAFNFAACSDDNENSIPNIGNENGKKLRKWILAEEGGVLDVYTTTFEYDSQGRMQKIEQIYEDAGEIISHTTGTVIWNGNNIHIEYNDGNHADYTLENGQISKIEYAENDYYWYMRSFFLRLYSFYQFYSVCIWHFNIAYNNVWRHLIQHIFSLACIL